MYVEVDSQLTEKLRFTTAVRYENYDAFDGEMNYKLSGRYELTEQWALRGSVSTGFRAPSTAELYSTKYSQGLTADLNIYTSARLSPNSDAAQNILGAEDLMTESASNYGFGVTFTGDNGWYASIDAYHIIVEDRISQVPNIDVDATIRPELIAAGVVGAETLKWVTFYTNNYDTETTGLDFIGGYDTTIWGGNVSFSFATNWNNTQYSDAKYELFDSDLIQLEDGIPAITGNIAMTYSVEVWSIMARIRGYGEWSDSSGLPDEEVQVQDFSPISLFDIRGTYHINTNLSLIVGVENLFNIYPDKATYQTNRGLLYSRHAPYDTDGGFFYTTLKYNF